MWFSKYQSHINQLAHELNCRLVQAVGMPGMMYVEFGYVEGPTIYSQSDYLVMLHELGHVAWGHTQGRPPREHERFYFDNGVLKSEAQAWEWALDRCLDPLQFNSRQFIWHRCLASYLRGANQAIGLPTRLLNGDRHWVQFLYDKPDDYFWSVAERMWN